MQAGAELIGDRPKEEIEKGREDVRLEGAAPETALQKLFRESQAEVPPAGGGEPPKEGELTVKGGEGGKGGGLGGDGIPFFAKMVESLLALQDFHANMLNVMIDDSADAAEAAKEAARKGMIKVMGELRTQKLKKQKLVDFSLGWEKL